MPLLRGFGWESYVGFYYFVFTQQKVQLSLRNAEIQQMVFFPVGKCIYKLILKYFWILLISNSVNCSLMSLIAVVRSHRGTSPDACWSGNKLTGADKKAG